MHRMDVPSATAGHQFTEGSPTAGVPATQVSASWMNDVQEELMSVLATAGIAPVKGTQDQLLKAMRSLSGGVIGAATNVKMTVATASATATLTADEIIVGTALGGQAFRLSSYSKTINLATTGPGGMDAGTPPANGYVALYAIYNPVTGASSILATNATLVIMPTVYGAAPYPAGYTASALLAVVPTNASLKFKTFVVKNRTVYTVLNTAFTGSSNVSLAPISLASCVPPNAKEVFGEMQLAISSAASLTMSIVADSTLVGQQNISCLSGSAGGGFTVNYANVVLTVPQTISMVTTTSGAAHSWTVYVTGYKI
jgi:hypothetical protein